MSTQSFRFLEHTASDNKTVAIKSTGKAFDEYLDNKAINHKHKLKFSQDSQPTAALHSESSQEK
jgi:hypothetical protein